MLLEICYKALFNSMTRSAYNKSENRRLIEKSQRLDGIVEAMKDRGESEEYIAEVIQSVALLAFMVLMELSFSFQIHETLTPPEREVLQKVKSRIKNLDSAEIGLDETIFLFQLYENYKN